MNRKLLLSILFLPTIILSASCSHSNSRISAWQPYTFNGVEFVNQRIEGLPSIWVRDGFSPRTEEPEKASVDTGRLPSGNGAVSGVCYVHSSGGKLADRSGFEPLADEQITIRNPRYGVSVIRSDSAGFFTEELLPEAYELFCRGAKTTVVVRDGKTVLTVIRGGKRMVD
jgi:hypothetical protein